MTELQKHSQATQRGGFAVGLIVGLLIGLMLALGVALYVTKVPVPFVNKVPQRTAGQDAAEAEKNKNWDPNSPLYGKNPARPSPSVGGAVTAPAAPAVATAPPAAPATPAPRASAAQSTRDPAAILADRPASAPAPKVAKAEPGTSASPSPAPAPTATATGPDPFMYFVQAGAYSRTEEADQQKARLAMLGMEGKVSEREQAGRTVYRVRLGPFTQKADADAAKDKLASSGVETQLVRVQR